MSGADEQSIQPAEGWHCCHCFYRFNRQALSAMTPAAVAAGREHFLAALDPGARQAPARIQTSLVAGHRADFGLMLLDADPLVIDGLFQQLNAGPLGPAMEATYSFSSLTEVSEYVPSVPEYAARLVQEGEDPAGPAYQAKVRAYEGRESLMRKQRLYPELPTWPNTCFYPMNKKRESGLNWFRLHLAERSRLMAEHGRTGMTFGGRVTQLITAGIGLDDWEWGVTLWARRPEFLKEIVYTMRFDEASARYAEFGPFFTSFVVSPAAILSHCRV